MRDEKLEVSLTPEEAYNIFSSSDYFTGLNLIPSIESLITAENLRDATQSYRRELALVLHPDKHVGEHSDTQKTAVMLFKEVANIYERKETRDEISIDESTCPLVCRILGPHYTETETETETEKYVRYANFILKPTNMETFFLLKDHLLLCDNRDRFLSPLTQKDIETFYNPKNAIYSEKDSLTNTQAQEIATQIRTEFNLVRVFYETNEITQTCKELPPLLTVLKDHLFKFENACTTSQGKYTFSCRLFGDLLTSDTHTMAEVKGYPSPSSPLKTGLSASAE